MKKKVLTVMAVLALMGGKAFASDYQWALKNLIKDFDPSAGKTTLVTGVLSFVGSDAEADTGVGVIMTKDGSATTNYLSIKVDKGDIVTVKVKNKGTNNNGTLSVIPVSGNSVSTRVEANGEASYIVDEATQDGYVVVYASENFVFTDISVESADYRELKKVYEKAVAKVNSSNAAAADFVGTSSKFYTTVKELINAQGLNIEQVLEKLEKAKTENTVTSSKSNLMGEFSADTLELEKIIYNAQNVYDAYLETTADKNQHYKDADAKVVLSLNKGLKKAEYDATGDIRVYEYTHDNSGNPKNDAKERAAGLEKYMKDNAEAYLDDIEKDSTVTALEGITFEAGNDTYPTAKIEALYDGVITRVENIVARYMYEKENGSRYEKVGKNVDLLESLKDDFDAVNDLSDLTKKYTALKKEWVNTDKHKYSKAEIEGSVLEGKLTACETSISSIEGGLIAEAQGKLRDDIKSLQEFIDQTSYDISTKFENEPVARDSCQTALANYQKELNDISKENEKGGFEVVENYKENSDCVASLRVKVENLRNAAATKQNSEIISNNTANLEKLKATIDSVKTDYREIVNKINGYKGLPGMTTAATDSINTSLVELSKILLDLDNYAKEADAEVKKLNSDLDNPGRWDYEANAKKVSDTSDEIQNWLAYARRAANESAYWYLTGHVYNNEYQSAPSNTWGYYKPFTIPYLNREIDEIKDHIEGRDSEQKTYNAEIVKKAKEALDLVINGGKDKNGILLVDKNGYCTEQGYVYNVKRFVDETAALPNDYADATKNAVADIIVGENDESNASAERIVYLGYYNNAIDAAGNIKQQVVDYDDLENKIEDYRIKWTVAKANVDLENKTLVDILEDVNAQLDALDTKLVKDGLAAGSKQSEYDAEFADISEKLWHVSDSAAFKAYNDANDLLVTVGDRLDEALNVVKELTKEEVVAEYTEQLNAKGDEIDEIGGKIKTAYDDRAKEGTFKDLSTKLGTILQEINDIKEAAEAADKETPGDFNGDGRVDSDDISFMLDAIANSKKDVTEFSKFVNDLKNYNKEQ